MSLQLRLLTIAMRWVAKPMLARVKDPVKARWGFVILCKGLRIPPFVLHQVEVGRVPLHWISVKRRRTDWVILYLHGGGYIAGSPTTHLGLTARIAEMTGLQVASPDYRLAPEHPAPAAFEDAVKAHEMILAKGTAPDRIIVAGDSAGGGLALALLADLCGRGLGPAGLFAFSPWTDLTMSSESLVTNSDADPLLPVARMSEAVEMVRGNLSPADPRLSPLAAVFEAPPPVFLQVGQSEILRDDSRRMADSLRRVGGQVQLDEWPGCPHVWHMLDGMLPEARKALVDVAGFVGRLVAATSGQDFVDTDRR